MGTSFTLSDVEMPSWLSTQSTISLKFENSNPKNISTQISKYIQI